MVATRGRTFKRPWRRSCHSSKLKSSSAPIGRKDSWCFHGVGSSNAPLLGSTAAEGLQRIGRASIATRWRFCGLPQSASCSENFVIPPDVFGQTLSARQRDVMKLIVRGLSNKEIASILNLAEGLTAKECLQSAEVCLALAHKTKELDTRAALLAFAYEFRTVAKRLERDERKLMVRVASDGMQK